MTVYRIARKFGGLAVLGETAKLKIRQILYCVHVCMAILFQTAKFKSANTQFEGKPPNLMTANISGYTVIGGVITCILCMHVLGELESIHVLYGVSLILIMQNWSTILYRS